MFCAIHVYTGTFCFVVVPRQSVAPVPATPSLNVTPIAVSSVCQCSVADMTVTIALYTMKKSCTSSAVGRRQVTVTHLPFLQDRFTIIQDTQVKLSPTH